MDLLVISVLLVLGIGVVLGIVILLTRGLFARDLTRALKRVMQQEQLLQEKADILEQRLGQQEAEYQLRLKRAEIEAERVVQEAKQQAVNIRAAAIEEAKHRARQLLLEAEQGKAQLKSELARELDSNVMQRVCDSLRSILSAHELHSLHESLIKELLEKLAQLDMSSSRSDVDRIEIRTAQPLSAEQSQEFTKWASNAIGSDTPFQIEEDASLVAGCIIYAGSTIVDNSLAVRIGGS